MALYNHVKKEVNAKIVYFGPGFGGKETSLGYVYRKMNPDLRSPLKSMSIQGNRMLFFDFSPTEKGVEGYAVRFHVYTVPGHVENPSTWKMVLKGVDGVVFVADSNPARHGENLVQMKALEEILCSSCSSTERMPLVLQYNRRDFPGAVSLDELEQHLNRFAVPSFPAVATTGDGVLDPLATIIKMLLAKIRATLGQVDIETTESLDSLAFAPVSVAPSCAEPPERSALSSGETRGGEEIAFEPESLPHAEESEPKSVSLTGDDISLRVAGGERLADGRIRVPLTVACGDVRRSFSIVITLALDETSAE